MVEASGTSMVALPSMVVVVGVVAAVAVVVSPVVAAVVAAVAPVVSAALAEGPGWCSMPWRRKTSTA